MPPRNDDPSDHWKIQRFDELQVETIELLRTKVERQQEEIAIIKAKHAIVAATIGALGGVGGSIISGVILYYLKAK